MAINIKPIMYRTGLTLRRNIAMLKESTGLTTKNFAYECNIGDASVNVYISNLFKTGGGATSPAGDKLLGILNKCFIGGIPKDVINGTEHRDDLYDIFNCASCKYRMQSQPGCFKFSFTKKEINKNPFVMTLKHGSFTFSKRKKCPYAS